MPFSTAGMNCRGIEPPKISSTNSNSLPRGSGSIRILQSPNWPWPPVCFLWRPCASTRAVIVSRYGNAGRLEQHFDAEAALQLRDRDLDVHLALAGEQQLVGLRIALVLDGAVFFLEAMHRRADLVFVAAALRLDRVRQHRLGKRDLREGDAGGLVGERVVGLGVLQLGDRAEVAGLDLRHVGGRLALQRDQVAEPLLRALRGVVHRRVRLQAALVDAEHRDAARRTDRPPSSRRTRRTAPSRRRSSSTVSPLASAVNGRSAGEGR